MEPTQLDSFSRSLATLGTRRTVLRLLRAVPAVGVLAALGEEKRASGHPRSRKHRPQSGVAHAKQGAKRKPKRKLVASITAINTSGLVSPAILPRMTSRATCSSGEVTNKL